MKIAFTFVALTVTLSKSKEIFSCGFDEKEDVHQGNDSSLVNESGSGIRSSDLFKWKDNTVPYYFDTGVSAGDKYLFRDQMDIIEANTCITFEETDLQFAPIHRLKITTDWQTSCMYSDYNSYYPRFHGQVSSSEISIAEEEVILEIFHQLTDNHGCVGDHIFSGGVLHELMHALGAIHTQQRVDRDEYIIYHEQCVQPNRKDQYRKQEDNPVDFSVPYRCDSIMHYKDTAGSNGCPTMEPRPGNTNCNRFGSDNPIEEDWSMLNLYHCA